MSHALHPSIFRAYDIRGIIDETLHIDDALQIGKAMGSHVISQGKGNVVCVGFDGRLSSPALEEKLVEGLMSAGADVIRIGLGPTPMLYFAVRYFNAQGGVMVTGSHNPPNHNGFKCMLDKLPLHGDEIAGLGARISKQNFLKGSGSVSFEDVKPAYLEKLLGAVTYKKDLKVVWDAGNGAGGEMMAELVKHLPGEHIILNEVIDGTFPVHHPDPTVEENLEQIKEVIRKEGADLGLAFDGDADRVGAIDNKARMILGDQLMVFYARDVLAQYPGGTIIADVKSSKTLFDEIKKAGGKPFMWKTGHSLIKNKMAELGSPLSGEVSGHIFFGDHYGFDDGLYGAIRILNIVGNQDTHSLADMMDELPQTFSTPEVKIDVSEERKFAVVEELKQMAQSLEGDINDVDGIRLTNEHGWWLIRASNTQAVLVARCEATSHESLNVLIESVQKLLAKCDLSWPI